MYASARHYSIRSVHDLDLWPLTLKTFLPMPTHGLNIYVKFHWNPFTKYRDIATREIGDNGRTHGWTEYRKTCCLHREFFGGGKMELLKLEQKPNVTRKRIQWMAPAHMRKLVWHHGYHSGRRPWVYTAIYPSSRLKRFVSLGATDVVRAAAVRLFLPAEPPDRFPSYVFTVWSVTVPQYLYSVHTPRHRASSVNDRSWRNHTNTCFQKHFYRVWPKNCGGAYIRLGENFHKNGTF